MISDKELDKRKEFEGIKKKLLPLIFIGIVVVALVIINKYLILRNTINNFSQTNNLKDDRPSLTVANTEIFIELAKTPEEQSKGLSGRNKLNNNEGMLFTWEKKLTPVFWMKDMNFAIDIIWISDGKVVGTSENVPPEPGKSDAELTKYPAPESVDAVLEVNAGFSRKNGIKVGDRVETNF